MAAAFQVSGFRFQVSGCLLALGLLSVSARAGDGRFEISAQHLPYTITNAGSYLLTESATVLNGALVLPGSVWKYWDKGSLPATNWFAADYDDSGWTNSGPAELGYGDNNSEATVVSYGPNANNKYITTYFRHAFVVTNRPSLVHLDLFIRYDDGIVVYVNGNEVRRENLPGGDPAYSTPALTNIPEVSANGTNGDPETIYYEFFVSQTNLVNGTNVIAAEVHQVSATSADLSFDLGLFGYTSGSGSPTSGITIASSDVVLDLGGHVLQGVPLMTRDGVVALPGTENIVIRNGTVCDWGDDGVDAAFSTNVIVRDVRAFDNAEAGIDGGFAATITDCIAGGSGMLRKKFETGDGIASDTGAVIARCLVRGNNNHGIVASSGTDISEVVLTRNAHDALHGGQALSVTRLLAGYTAQQINGKLGDGVEIELGSVVIDSVATALDDGMKTRDNGRSIFSRCLAHDNINDGLKAQFGTLFLRCVAAKNGDDGITMTSQNTALHSLALRNDPSPFNATPGGGVNLEGTGNFIAFNHVVDNAFGVAAANNNNLIVGNSARRNARSNFWFAAGNQTGGFTNRISGANRWSNFELGR
jgi:hypothetical protein